MAIKKTKGRNLKAYPSVTAMVVQTSSQKKAMMFLAEAVTDLQQRVRRVELKAAVQASESNPKPSLWRRIKTVLGL